MKMLSKTMSFLMVFMLATVLTLFTPLDAEPATGARPPSEITIIMVPKALDNPIFLDAKVAAEAKAAELGIKFEFVGPVRSDAAEQVSVMEGLVERRVDGIIVSVNDAEALRDVINRAVDAGIMVATFDSDSIDSKRSFYVGTHNYNIGYESGKRMLEHLPDGGNLAILTGRLGMANHEARIQGFMDAIEGSKINVLPIQSGEADVLRSVEVINQFTAANPDLDAWWFTGGWPLNADPQAMPELKRFHDNGGVVVSLDSAYPMLRFLEEEYLDELLGQNFVLMGSLGVETLYKLIQGENVDLGDEDNQIDTGYELVDKDNWEAVKATKSPY